MASQTLGSCCVQGFTHEGTAKGSWTTLAGLKTYIAEPANKDHSKAIYFFHDAFGVDLINNQLLCDDFAANGYYTIMADLFKEDAAPAKILTEGLGDFDLGAWVGRHQMDTVKPYIEQIIAELRSKHGVKRLGAVGYCWGAKPVVTWLDDRNGDKIDVGYVAHPSLTVKEDYPKMHGPFAIGAAEVDNMFETPLRHEVEGLLAERKQPYQITLYGGVHHGFAVRADLKVKEQVVAKDNAFLQAVSWFNTYL